MHSSSFQWQSPLHQLAPMKLSPLTGHLLQSVAECEPQLTAKEEKYVSCTKFIRET